MTPKSHFDEYALAYLKAEGFSEASSEHLDSPAFPDTFAPSAYHQLVRSLVSQPVQNGRRERWAGSDWVYRHVDVEKIGISPFHLSAFRMLVFLEAASPSDERKCRERTIDVALKIISFLGRESKDLYITYFGGCSDTLTRGINPNEIRDLWTSRGVPANQLVPIQGKANLTNVLRVGEPAGPRCEVLLRWKQSSFVEIGTIVFERFLLESARPLTLTEAPSVVCGAAFGVERAEMITCGGRSLFDLPELQNGIAVARTEFNSLLASIHCEHIRRLVDAVRSCLIILSKCSMPFSPPRSERLTKLRKVVLRSTDQLGCQNVASLVERVGKAIQPSCKLGKDDSLPERAMRLLLR